jgi:hypothetical protein
VPGILAICEKFGIVGWVKFKLFQRFAVAPSLQKDRPKLTDELSEKEYP